MCQTQSSPFFLTNNEGQKIQVNATTYNELATEKIAGTFSAIVLDMEGKPQAIVLSQNEFN